MTNSGGQASRQLSTRERIVHATVELMAEQGIDRVRTRAVAERAGVNPALVHYHFGSMSALLLEAAEDALIRELGPSVDLLTSAPTFQEGITAVLQWIEADGQRTPGSTILAEAMVKATRDPAFRRWTGQASRRWRMAILERLRRALADGEIEATLDLEATAVLLAAALDGLLFHRLVNGKLDVQQTIAPIEAMLRPSRQPSLGRGRSRDEGGVR